MNIRNVFRGPVPSNIADAHVTIMDAVNSIPQYYLDRFMIDKVIVTDYSDEQFFQYVTLFDPTLQAIVLASFQESTDTDLLKHSFLSIYIHLFITNHPSFEGVLLDQSRAIPYSYRVFGDDELNVRNLFIFLFAVVVSGVDCKQIQPHFLHFFRRVDQLVKYGHLSVSV